MRTNRVLAVVISVSVWAAARDAGAQQADSGYSPDPLAEGSGAETGFGSYPAAEPAAGAPRGVASQFPPVSQAAEGSPFGAAPQTPLGTSTLETEEPGAVQPAAYFAMDPKQAAPRRSCTVCTDGSCDACQQGPDPDQRFNLLGFSGADTFRSIPDGSFQSHFGSVSGLNLGLALPYLDQYGFGWQLGASYGVYDFDGRASSLMHPTGALQQGFFTTGFFRRAKPGQILSFGGVFDLMTANNFGEFAVSPTLGQWRGQVELAANDRNSFGAWGTIRNGGQTSFVGEFPLQFRAVNQVNLFWHHKFAQAADSWFYVGSPVAHKLGSSGTVGSLTIGGSASVPISEQLALYANVAYLKPSARAGALAAMEDAYNVGVGLAWYPGWNLHRGTVRGIGYVPYMPLANNGNFFVDTNQSF